MQKSEYYLDSFIYYFISNITSWYDKKEKITLNYYFISSNIVLRIIVPICNIVKVL